MPSHLYTSLLHPAEEVVLAGAGASARAEDSPARSGSPDEQLDIQKALQIVSDHYGIRNATFSLQSGSVITVAALLWRLMCLCQAIESKLHQSFKTC